MLSGETVGGVRVRAARGEDSQDLALVKPGLGLASEVSEAQGTGTCLPWESTGTDWLV